MNRTEKLVATGVLVIVATQIAVGAWIALTLRPIERSVRYSTDYEYQLEAMAEKLDAIAKSTEEIARSTESIDTRQMNPIIRLRDYQMPPTP